MRKVDHPHDCAEHWQQVGNPVFDDMALTMKVMCSICGKVFWVIYTFFDIEWDRKQPKNGLLYEP